MLRETEGHKGKGKERGERERDRQTDRQTERNGNKHISWERETQRVRDRGRDSERGREREREREFAYLWRRLAGEGLQGLQLNQQQLEHCFPVVELWLQENLACLC